MDEESNSAASELAAARETIKRLNRRVQVAEAAVAERVKASRGGMGRGLANAAAEMYKRERDEALAELAAVRKWIAEAPSVFIHAGGIVDRVVPQYSGKRVRLLVDDGLP